MQGRESQISCPIFREEEPLIKEFADKINATIGIHEKAKFAEELQEKVGVMLSCLNFDGENLDCKNCRLICNLRKRFVDVIMRIKKLMT